MTVAAICTFLDPTDTVFDHSHSTCTYNPNIVMERRQSILGSLRNKFSKSGDKGDRSDSRLSRVMSFKSTRSGSVQEHEDPNPFTTTSPPTRRPVNEPPPAYTPQAMPTHMTVPEPAEPRLSTSSARDDRFSFLASFDTVFLIDDSGSMAGRSWRETAQALETITPICTAHDADGIDIYFLNAPDSEFHHNVTVPSTVTEIFSTVRPRGGTPTGQKLNQILRPYLARCAANLDGVKPLNIIVITDGVPSDDVESVIISAAKKLDRADAPAWQVGIQFFQVGREPEAREHLKQLDDGLAELAGEDVRDMVDTVPFLGNDDAELNAEGILKVVLGAVNRRLDRKKSNELHR
ncbi:hypothetical protein BC567DRAFT_207141 [Phyllosticta citribraziliensis]